MSNKNTDFDIVIVGGGIVGMTLACALVSKMANLANKINIAVIETRDANFDNVAKKDIDLRVSAISRASQRLLTDIDVWPSIKSKRLCEFTDMHVWDDTGEGVIHFDSADLGEPYLGHIIENNVILSSLYETVSKYKNITLICPAKINHIQYASESAEITLDDNATMSTSLVIAADGSSSWVRQQAGIIVRGWDYPQDALVTWVKTENSHLNTAWQRFMPDGPLAFLPLENSYSSIVWSSNPEHIQQLLQFSDSEFRLALTHAFSNTLGAVIENGPRARFPLRYFVCESYIKPRLALIGDAAHTMHPLAGQGVNVGIQDVISFSEILCLARQQEKDLGATSTLRCYERARRAENAPMLATVNGFQRLFGSENSTVTWLRNNGMKLAQNLPLLKNKIMRQAMGL